MSTEQQRVEVSRDPFDLDAADEAKANEDEQARVKRLIEVSDLKWLMAHKQGRRFMWGLLEKHGVYRSSFSVEPLEMAFLEGQRNDGLRLMGAILEHAPERYAEMLQEQKDGRRTTSSTRSSSSSSSKPGSASSDARD